MPPNPPAPGAWAPESRRREAVRLPQLPLPGWAGQMPGLSQRACDWPIQGKAAPLTPPPSSAPSPLSGSTIILLAQAQGTCM